MKMWARAANAQLENLGKALNQIQEIGLKEFNRGFEDLGSHGRFVWSLEKLAKAIRQGFDYRDNASSEDKAMCNRFADILEQLRDEVVNSWRDFPPFGRVAYWNLIANQLRTELNRFIE
jgi:hypothetical protein